MLSKIGVCPVVPRLGPGRVCGSFGGPAGVCSCYDITFVGLAWTSWGSVRAVCLFERLKASDSVERHVSIVRTRSSRYKICPYRSFAVTCGLANTQLPKLDTTVLESSVLCVFLQNASHSCHYCSASAVIRQQCPSSCVHVIYRWLRLGRLLHRFYDRVLCYRSSYYTGYLIAPKGGFVATGGCYWIWSGLFVIVICPIGLAVERLEHVHCCFCSQPKSKDAMHRLIRGPTHTAPSCIYGMKRVEEDHFRRCRQFGFPFSGYLFTHGVPQWDRLSHELWGELHRKVARRKSN